MSAGTSGVDTISNLPHNVLDEILGCLPLKDAVKTSILSKDWRYKWVTRAKLDFSYEFFMSFNDIQKAKTVIYQVMLLHKGPIMKFTLQGLTVTSFSDIDHWILFLSKKNVQKITLHMLSLNNYRLPSQFFIFRQLRHLKLSQCLFYPPPSFKGFENLVKLDLQNVTFVPTILKNLISECPLLETLRLNLCTNLDILEINATNLKHFEFFGTTKSICFKNTPMVRNVTLWLNPQVLPNSLPDCSNLTRFFHYMPSLHKLKLCSTTLQYLTMGGLPESPPTTLNNVKSLILSEMSLSSVEEISSAVYLITNCVKLQDLKIYSRSTDDVVEPVVQFLRAQSI